MNEKLKQTYFDLRAVFPEWGSQKTIGIARSALAMYEEARERLLQQSVQRDFACTCRKIDENTIEEYAGCPVHGVMAQSR